MTDETKGSRSDSDRTASPHSRPTGPAKPTCKLIGADGNVFSIIGRVRRALVEAGQVDRAREFVERAFRAKSYDEVLVLCLEYVDALWAWDDDVEPDLRLRSRRHDLKVREDRIELCQQHGALYEVAARDLPKLVRLHRRRCGSSPPTVRELREGAA